MRVRATNVAGDGVPGGGTTDQDFALVVSNVGSPTGKAALTTTQVKVTDEDGDGVIEPLEKFSIQTTLANTGPVASEPITGTLTTTAPGDHADRVADELRRARPGPELRARRPARRRAREQRLRRDARDLDAARSRRAGRDRRRDAIIVPGSRSSARVAKPATPVTIPDSNAGWTTIPLTSATPASSTTSTSSSMQINHPWVSDLEIALEAPDGTTVMLADNTGVSGQNFTGTILDDEADVPIQSATTASAPFSGRWRPAQPLSALDGKPLAGTWKLRVRDLADARRGQRHVVVAAAAGLQHRAAGVDRRSAPGLLNAGTPITLDASGSSDRDDAITEYRWDFDGDGNDRPGHERSRWPRTRSAPPARSSRRSRSSTRAARPRSAR